MGEDDEGWCHGVPTSNDIAAVTITRAVVTGESKPLVRRKAGQAAA